MEKFKFQKRSGKLNWRKIAEADVKKVVAEVDVDYLQEFVENITFSEVTEEDLTYFTDTHFLKLFRISQMTIEYLLFVQNYLSSNYTEAQSKLAEANTELSGAKKKIVDLEAENAKLTLDLKYYRKISQTLEVFHGNAPLSSAALDDSFFNPTVDKGRTVFKCSLCRAAYSSSSFLLAHVQRRHPESAEVATRLFAKLGQVPIAVPVAPTQTVVAPVVYPNVPNTNNSVLPSLVLAGNTSNANLNIQNLSADLEASVADRVNKSLAIMMSKLETTMKTTLLDVKGNSTEHIESLKNQMHSELSQFQQLQSAQMHMLEEKIENVKHRVTNNSNSLQFVPDRNSAISNPVVRINPYLDSITQPSQVMAPVLSSSQEYYNCASFPAKSSISDWVNEDTAEELERRRKAKEEEMKKKATELVERQVQAELEKRRNEQEKELMRLKVEEEAKRRLELEIESRVRAETEKRLLEEQISKRVAEELSKKKDAEAEQLVAKQKQEVEDAKNLELEVQKRLNLLNNAKENVDPKASKVTFSLPPKSEAVTELPIKSEPVIITTSDSSAKVVESISTDSHSKPEQKTAESKLVLELPMNVSAATSEIKSTSDITTVGVSKELAASNSKVEEMDRLSRSFEALSDQIKIDRNDSSKKSETVTELPAPSKTVEMPLITSAAVAEAKAREDKVAADLAAAKAAAAAKYEADLLIEAQAQASARRNRLFNMVASSIKAGDYARAKKEEEYAALLLSDRNAWKERYLMKYNGNAEPLPTVPEDQKEFMLDEKLPFLPAAAVPIQKEWTDAISANILETVSKCTKEMLIEQEEMLSANKDGIQVTETMHAWINDIVRKYFRPSATGSTTPFKASAPIRSDSPIRLSSDPLIRKSLRGSIMTPSVSSPAPLRLSNGKSTVDSLRASFGTNVFGEFGKKEPEKPALAAVAEVSSKVSELNTATPEIVTAAIKPNFNLDIPMRNPLSPPNKVKSPTESAVMTHATLTRPTLEGHRSPPKVAMKPFGDFTFK